MSSPGLNSKKTFGWPKAPPPPSHETRFSLVRITSGEVFDAMGRALTLQIGHFNTRLDQGRQSA